MRHPTHRGCQPPERTGCRRHTVTVVSSTAFLSTDNVTCIFGSISVAAIVVHFSQRLLPLTPLFSTCPRSFSVHLNGDNVLSPYHGFLYLIRGSCRLLETQMSGYNFPQTKWTQGIARPNLLFPVAYCSGSTLPMDFRPVQGNSRRTCPGGTGAHCHRSQYRTN